MSLVPLSRLPLVAPGSLFCCALLRCDVFRAAFCVVEQLSRLTVFVAL